MKRKVTSLGFYKRSMKRIIVAGGRDFNLYSLMEEKMQQVASPHIEHTLAVDMGGYYMPASEFNSGVVVVSGKADGADALGERWARDNKLRVKEFYPDWETHGNSAGPIRNKEMAEYADILVAFWDGKSRGTKNMIETALKEGLEIHVYRY